MFLRNIQTQHNLSTQTFQLSDFYRKAENASLRLRSAQSWFEQTEIMVELCTYFENYLPLLKYAAYELSDQEALDHLEDFRSDLVIFFATGWVQANYYYNIIYSSFISEEDIEFYMNDYSFEHPHDDLTSIIEWINWSEDDEAGYYEQSSNIEFQGFVCKYTGKMCARAA